MPAKKQSKIRINNPFMVWPYSPTYKPFPPLEIQDACECPRIVVSLSAAYLPYILGALELFRWEDAFTGTEAQKTRSVGLFRDLMGVFAMAARDCGCDDDILRIYRINPDTGQLEVSEDNGATWETSPDDPIENATQLPPLGGEPGSVKRCEAANNVVGQLQAIQARWSGWIGVLNSLTEFLAKLISEVIALLFIPQGNEGIAEAISRLISKIYEVGSAIFNTSSAAYDAMFTPQIWENALCILRCEVNADGRFDDQSWSRVRSRFENELNVGGDTAGSSLACMVDVLGTVGLNNATTMHNTTQAPCDDCECGCGDGCVFGWSGVLYNAKPADPEWFFGNPDCDVSPTYQCIPLAGEGLLSGLPGQCCNGLRYSVARAGGSTSTGIEIEINGAIILNDPMTGMATDGTPQAQREIYFAEPVEVTTLRFTVTGLAGQVYIREVELGVCVA